MLEELSRDVEYLRARARRRCDNGDLHWNLGDVHAVNRVTAALRHLLKGTHDERQPEDPTG